MCHVLKIEGDESCFLSEDTNNEAPELILNRTRPRPEQVPFPKPLPPPPCPTRRSRELHIRRLENDMIKQGATDPFLAAFIKCTASDQRESSDADIDSDRSSQRGWFSPSSPMRRILWKQLKDYFSPLARKERRRKSRRSRISSMGRDSDDRQRTSSSVYVHQLRFNQSVLVCS